MECFLCVDGWVHCATGNSLNGQRISTNFSWVFCLQIGPSLLFHWDRPCHTTWSSTLQEGIKKDVG